MITGTLRSPRKHIALLPPPPLDAVDFERILAFARYIMRESVRYAPEDVV